MYEAGITMIKCGAGTKKERSLLFSKALPVLMNRETGRFELALPDAGGPVVKAGKTGVKKDRTVYSGGVEFSNGVFSWKGDKLEVSEKDDVTTLTF